MNVSNTMNNCSSSKTSNEFSFETLTKKVINKSNADLMTALISNCFSKDGVLVQGEDASQKRDVIVRSILNSDNPAHKAEGFIPQVIESFMQPSGSDSLPSLNHFDIAKLVKINFLYKTLLTQMVGGSQTTYSSSSCDLELQSPAKSKKRPRNELGQDISEKAKPLKKKQKLLQDTLEIEDLPRDCSSEPGPAWEFLSQKDSKELFKKWNLRSHVFLDCEKNEIKQKKTIKYLNSVFFAVNQKQTGKDFSDFSERIKDTNSNDFRLIRHPQIGIGIVANKKFNVGDFIMSYTGEVYPVFIGRGGAPGRPDQEDNPSKNQGEYNISLTPKYVIFQSYKVDSKGIEINDLIKCTYLPEGTSTKKHPWDIVVDATNRGNISRFINHGGKENSNATFIREGCFNEKVTAINVYATKEIEEGEQILCDYGYESYWKKLNITPIQLTPQDAPIRH